MRILFDLLTQPCSLGREHCTIAGRECECWNKYRAMSIAEMKHAGDEHLEEAMEGFAGFEDITIERVENEYIYLYNYFNRKVKEMLDKPDDAFFNAERRNLWANGIRRQRDQALAAAMQNTIVKFVRDESAEY